MPPPKKNFPPFLSVRISISVIPLLLISALPPLSFGSVDAIPSTEKELFCVFVKLFNMYIFYFHTIFSTTGVSLSISLSLSLLSLTELLRSSPLSVSHLSRCCSYVYPTAVSSRLRTAEAQSLIATWKSFVSAFNTVGGHNKKHSAFEGGVSEVMIEIIVGYL